MNIPTRLGALLWACPPRVHALAAKALGLQLVKHVERETGVVWHTLQQFGSQPIAPVSPGTSGKGGGDGLHYPYSG